MKRLLLVSLLTLLAACTCGPAKAERIANPIALFAGLDKVSGVTTTFEIPIGEERRFGSIIVKPEVCYTRPVTEQPKTTSFVKIDQIEMDSSRKTIFSGWMFAESPGLSAMEHATYDIWLTGCRDPNAPPPAVETAPAPDAAAQPEQPKDGQPED